jgi:hypothetical protein
MIDDPNRNEPLPERVVEKLCELASKTALLVPPAIDEVILSQANNHFGQAAARRSKISHLAWLAAAACVALLAFFGFQHLKPSRFERADIDRNGHVDILDAFDLARRIQHGSSPAADINGDGIINKADVDAIAAQAVKLKKGV